MHASKTCYCTAKAVLEMKTPDEFLFGASPSSSRLISYRCCVASAHRYKAHKADILDNRADIAINTVTRETPNKTHFPLKRWSITFKQTILDEIAFSLHSEKDYEVGGSTGRNNLSCTLASLLKTNDGEQVGEPLHESEVDIENNDKKQTSRQSILSSGEDLKQKVPNGSRCPDRERHSPQRYTVNALVRKYDDDEPSIQHALNGQNSSE